MAARCVTLILLCVLTGCVTFTPYTGDRSTNYILESRADYVFAAILKHALEKNSR